MPTKIIPQTPSRSVLVDSYGMETDEKILVVDDDPIICNLFAEFLSERFECSKASAADEALKLLGQSEYSLVISDVMMAGRNGIELLRDIVSRYPSTAVIMMSGIDRPQRVRDALRIGAFDYLIKPCEFDQLMLSVDRALERRRLQKAASRYKADLEKQNAALAVRTAELELAQTQLVHSAKMASLGELAAGVAHELNNPAGFIYGNMDILREYLAQFEDLLLAYNRIEISASQKTLIDEVKAKINYDQLTNELHSVIDDCAEGAKRIRDVVQNLRLFSRLDEADLKRVDLHDGIESTIRLLSRHYQDGRISLVRNYANLPLVSCYAGQLNQVWMNILINAAQAIKERGQVVITTEVDGDWVKVSIKDNGKGIPKSKLSQVFNPFFTTKPVGEGTGLGLSISYGIIKRHGGTIEVESSEGNGTTFTIRIPADAKLSESAEAPAEHYLEKQQ